MKFKRLSTIGSALVLSASTLLTVGFAGTAFAAAPYTCTWTGATNNNFSNAGNWSGCNSAAPQPGDDDNLVFNNTSLSSNVTLTDDISNLALTNITFSGTNAYTFTITPSSNQSITLTSGVTSNISNNSYPTQTINTPIIISGNQTLSVATKGQLELTGGVQGSGNITISASGNGAIQINNSPNYTGTISDGTGDLTLDASTGPFTMTGSVHITNGASLALSDDAGNNESFTFPLSISGNGDSSNNPALAINNPPGTTLTLAGPTTLGSNIQISSYGLGASLDITGAINGAYSITTSSYSGTDPWLDIDSSSNSSLTPNGTGFTNNVEDFTANSPSSPIDVVNTETGVVTGIYGDISVFGGGTITGTGQVGALSILSGGTVAPGDDPACMTVTGNFTESGTYSPELDSDSGPCTGYDQMKVGGTVTLGGTLSLRLNFTPTVGQSFDIITETGTPSAVNGTFAGLPEGTVFASGSTKFKITYLGGTSGHDVVLTVVSPSTPVTGTPGAPDTGLGLTNADIGLTLLGTTMMAGGIYFISRKLKQPLAIKRH